MNNKSSQFFHPWHSLSTGDNTPEQANGIIEITQGSKAKYELDKKTGFLRLDRILASNLSYPFHYGFIPQTYCPDNDPLDILILCSEPLLPLSIVETTILGAMQMIDEGEQDDKIIAVPTHDPFKKHCKDLKDIEPEALNAIKSFFQTYKQPENKTVIVEKFLDRQQACNLIAKAQELYKKTFPKI